MSVFRRKYKYQGKVRVSKSYSYDFIVENQRYRGSLPKARTRAEALRAEAKIREQAYLGGCGPAVKTPGLSDFIEEVFLPWCKGNNRTWREYGYRAKIIIEHFGNCRMRAISPLQIERFKMARRNGLSKRGGQRSPAAVNRELETLSRIFNLGIELGFVTDNPCSGVRHFREDNERSRYLLQEEEQRLFAVLRQERPQLAAIVALALQTGMRRREVLQLQWAHIDFERGVIQVVNNHEQGSRTKSRKSRQVPMTSTARELLRELVERGAGPYVFPNELTGRPLTDIKHSFGWACRKAGIEDLHFHDLRRTTATRLGDAGVDTIKLAAIMGWSDIRIAVRYTHPLRLLEAMETLAGQRGVRAAVPAEVPTKVGVRR
jgi:integrase